MPVNGYRSDEEICAIAQEVSDKYLAPRAEKYDASADFPLDNLQELGKCGLMGLMVPPQYGGLGGTMVQFAKVAEILAKACPSTSMIWGMHHNQYITLVECGNERQKAAFLPGIASGKTLVASATTEPGTGGNFFYCNSSARRVNGGWELSATKPVVTSAKYADLCFSITRTSPDAPGNQLSFFIVPCHEEGVAPIGEWNTVGMRATQSSGLQFTNVRLTDIHLLGEEGGFGPIVLTSMMPLGLCGFAAAWLGSAQAAYDFAVGHVKGRIHRFSVTGDEQGHSVASYESVQRQIAEAGILLHQTRALLHEVARAIDESKQAPFQPVPFDKVFPIIDRALALRVASGENAVAVTTTALRVAGAQGYRRDYLRIERCHRDALAAQVMAPTPDLIKVVLGKMQLGYPFQEAIRLR
jgi:alkylation response protein AidB-like acyl-CoA dehydrogenase